LITLLLNISIAYVLLFSPCHVHKTMLVPFKVGFYLVIMFEGEILVLLGFSVWRRTNHTV